MSTVARTVRRASGLYVPAPPSGGGGFNLQNNGCDLITSGGPGTGVMGGRYWNSDHNISERLIAPIADCEDVIHDITDQLTVAWWVRSKDSPSWANHWAKGNVGGIQVRQPSGDETAIRFDINDTVLAGEISQEGPTGSFGLNSSIWDFIWVNYDGSYGIEIWKIDNGTGLATKLDEELGVGGNIVWDQADWTVSAQMDEIDGTYEDHRSQDFTPPVIFDSLPAPSSFETPYANRNSAAFETSMLALNPVHFVNELDGLTDTLGV